MRFFVFQGHRETPIGQICRERAVGSFWVAESVAWGECTDRAANRMLFELQGHSLQKTASGYVAEIFNQTVRNLSNFFRVYNGDSLIRRRKPLLGSSRWIVRRGLGS